MATPKRKPVRVGIAICDRYRTCAGDSRYAGQEVELVGFTACAGCPGGNIEYAPEEMKKNGEAKHGMRVVIGTHGDGDDVTVQVV